MKIPRVTFFGILVTFFLLPSATHLSALSPQDPVGQINLESLEDFREPSSNWTLGKNAFAETYIKHSLTSSDGSGVLLNKPSDDARGNLFTKMEHGDIDLEIEILVPKQSNSGIYFQSRYEVQILDSWRVQNPTFADMGGIYERWNDSRPEASRGFEGSAPMMNVARAPGLWQKLAVKFRAPQFDADGNKTSNAIFKEVKLNGVVIHVDVEVSGPTRAAADESSEVAMAPIMIQGDHGPVAFRNIKYKLYSGEEASLHSMNYKFVDGSFQDYSILEDDASVVKGSSPLFVDKIGQDRQEYLAEYRGTLDLPKSGVFNFELFVSWFQGDPHFSGKDIGDAILTIDGLDPIILHKGPNELGNGSIKLEAGSHDLLLRTRKNRRWTRNLVTLSIEGPGIEKQLLNDPSSLPPAARNAPIVLSDKSRPIIQHGFMNFEDEKKTHVMAVGGFNGINFSVNLENGSLLHLWSGDFLDAGPMWQGRGNTQLMVPLGSVIELDELGLLDINEDFELKYFGYVIDPAGILHLTYKSSQGHKIIQTFSYPDKGGLRRRIEISEGSDDLRLILVRAESMNVISDGFYSVNDGTFLVRMQNAVGELFYDGNTLIASLNKGQTINGVSSFEYDLVW